MSLKKVIMQCKKKVRLLLKDNKHLYVAYWRRLLSDLSIQFIHFTRVDYIVVIVVIAVIAIIVERI